MGYVTTKVAALAKESLAQPGMPNSIPVLSHEQIATDVNYRQRKIGTRLLKEALQVTVHVAHSAAGMRQPSLHGSTCGVSGGAEG